MLKLMQLLTSRQFLLISHHISIPLPCVSLCEKAAGGGGCCGEALPPESLSEGPLQGAERHLQPDDPVLQTAAGAALAAHAGPPHLRLSLLFGHGRRRPVGPLGLEELSWTDIFNRSLR